MMPSRLREHLSTKYPNDKDNPIEYFQDRSTIIESFKKQHAANKDGLIVSYRISQLIAKSGKSYIIGKPIIIPLKRIYLNSIASRYT